MIPWTAFKQTVDNNQSIIYYKIEDSYKSNDINIDNVARYFLTTSISPTTYECFICIEDPKNLDQTDFDDNYKTSAILI